MKDWLKRNWKRVKWVMRAILVFAIVMIIIAVTLMGDSETTDPVADQETEEITPDFNDLEWLRQENQNLDNAERLAEARYSDVSAASSTDPTALIDELLRQQRTYLEEKERSILQHRIATAHEESAILMVEGRADIVIRDRATAESLETIREVLEGEYQPTK